MGDLLSPLFVLWLVIIVMILAVWAWSRRRQQHPGTRRFLRSDVQMEFDLRLTYKRFKELYPFSEVTYQDCKRMQVEKAFRRAISSEKNKRMAR